MITMETAKPISPSSVQVRALGMFAGRARLYMEPREMFLLWLTIMGMARRILPYSDRVIAPGISMAWDQKCTVRRAICRWLGITMGITKQTLLYSARPIVPGISM